MRTKCWFIKVGLIAGVCLFTLFSGISHASIVDSGHDLSSSGGGPGSGFIFETSEKCVFCHTPHRQNTQVRAYTGYAWGALAYYNTSGAVGTTGQIMLLWNQALSNAPQSGNPTAYELYTSSTMDSVGNSVRIHSLVCLSCHDGVGAMNVMTTPPIIGELDTADANGYPVSLGGIDQIGDISYDGAPFGGEGANIGGRRPDADTGVVNLSNDHPISIDYTSTHPDIARGGLWDPGAADGTVKTTKLRLFYSPDTLALTSIECSTCHDPHGEGTDTTAGKYPFLAESKENSGLCLECHKK